MSLLSYLKNMWLVSRLHVTKSSKGQMSVVGIIMTVIALITFVVLQPLLSTVITMGKAGTNNTMMWLIYDAIPIMILIGIFVLPALYSSIQRPM